MKKRFNTTGVCVPRKHYMVNINDKLKEIIKLIDNECYFTINRPRQYGKTTTLSQLKKELKKSYLVISISFEGIGDIVFQEEKSFVNAFIEIVSDNLEFENEEESRRLLDLAQGIQDMKDLSKIITKFIKNSSKEVILFIDEVDKSSNNQLFLSFIGMLRNKYLAREEEVDYTFKSVILAGVHDVKTLKLKIRSDESAKYNSPWNIAADFNVDMSFSSKEITTMLDEYSDEKHVTMDLEYISKQIHFFTSGYPFLVSRICQIIDERVYDENNKVWEKDCVKKAIKILNEETNTLFESLVKNLENNQELYDLTKRILIDGETIIFNPLDPVISIGLTYGIFKKGKDGVEVSNKIFEEIIYNYMLSRIRTSTRKMSLYNFKDNFIQQDGSLNIEKILMKFMQFMKEQYSSKDEEFIETHGRLLFLAFIKPIINGVGFDFKEVQISEEKRLDIVITYNSYKYIIEMKIWRGQKYHDRGIEQLYNYLDIHNLNRGYLVVFNFNKNKEYKQEFLKVSGKEIFQVFV